MRQLPGSKAIVVASNNDYDGLRSTGRIAIEDNESEAKEAKDAVPGEDYYFENGLIVMTAAYHLKRGYCCGSGCRHCPYAPKHQAGSTELEKDAI